MPFEPKKADGLSSAPEERKVNGKAERNKLPAQSAAKAPAGQATSKTETAKSGGGQVFAANKAAAKAGVPASGAAKSPAGAAKSPAGAAKSPAGAAKSPAGAAKSPAGAAKSPAGAAKSPAGAAKSPAGAAKSTAGVAKSPAGVAKSPVGVAKSPAGVAKSPVGVAKSPAGVAKSPAGVAKSPAGAAKSAIGAGKPAVSSETQRAAKAPVRAAAGSKPAQTKASAPKPANKTATNEVAKPTGKAMETRASASKPSASKAGAENSGALRAANAKNGDDKTKTASAVRPPLASATPRQAKASAVSAFDPEKLRAELAQQSKDTRQKEAVRAEQTQEKKQEEKHEVASQARVDAKKPVQEKRQSNGNANGAQKNTTVQLAAQKGKRRKKKKEKTRKLGLFTRAVHRGADAAGTTEAGSFLGYLLYSLGFFAECNVLRVLRVLRDFGGVVGQMLIWLFGGAFGAVKRILSGFLQDIAAPFVRMQHGVSNIRRVVAEERKRGSGKATKKALGYFRNGVKTHAHLLANLAGFLLPLAAVVILGFTIYSLLGIDYALAVVVEDKVIGYVEDQSVLEDAKKMLRARLRLSNEQTVSDWQFNPNLTIGRARNLTGKQQLVNDILKDAEFDLVQATGLYVGEDLIAVTTEGERLEAFLEDWKDKYRKKDENATIEFVLDVSCEPNPDDVFLKSSVLPYEELEERLSTDVEQEKSYILSSDQTLTQVSNTNGLSLSALKLMNPSFSEMEPEEMLPSGTRVLTRKAKAFLQVQSKERRQTTETIPFPAQSEDSVDMMEGTTRITVQGVDGEQTVFDDYTFIDGEEEASKIERQDDLTKIMLQPITQVTQVGIFTKDMVDGEYKKVYIDPVPDSARSSRGGGPGMGHRGRDINGPVGTPIYATNAGVVKIAGSHYSYGNYIEITHPDGLVTLYAHASELLVSAGDVVRQGDKIALMGSTGNSSGSHLHIEFQRNGQLLNPDDYISGKWKR